MLRHAYALYRLASGVAAGGGKQPRINAIPMEGTRPTLLCRHVKDKIIVAVDNMPAMAKHFLVQLPCPPSGIAKRDEPA